MKVDILTREYPPHVYGGAGVHAEELSKVLAERIDVTVRAFDGKRTEADIPAIPNAANAKGSLKVVGYDTPSELADANPALKTFGVDLQIANDVDADIIHAHTWYACLAGYLAKMLHGTPLVITAHSLEPFRPWKREQLGGGYNLSSWAEKDAYEHADRVIVMNDGLVVMDGKPREVFTRKKELEDIGLAVPDTVSLLFSLREAGMDVPVDAITVEECADAIAKNFT